MEALVAKGLVRSIGLSNFSRKKLEGLLQQGVQVKPAVLQVRWSGQLPFSTAATCCLPDNETATSNDHWQWP